MGCGGGRYEGHEGENDGSDKQQFTVGFICLSVEFVAAAAPPPSPDERKTLRSEVCLFFF